jgi:predicted dehydrogenase
VEAVLGKIIEVDARAEIRWPIVRLIETGVESVRETADYVGILGKTTSGAAFTADIEAGVPQDSVRFSCEVRGADGRLSLTSDHPYGCQAGDLTLRSSAAFAEPDAPAVSDNIMETAINVGEVYTQLARDLNQGTYRTPGFRDALHNSCLVEAVRRSAEGGVRQKVKTDS